ncbi:YdjY domain-containing protein [Neorhodopirellula pilleata]|uniref:Uncharacterized protein n=1 Tax=Neorhodopirellula pilleata TaxID=2714738 RepID=A0A5C5ZFA1_9BACT|nr:YdjY domain-containing protein [Neorhodopirellula pilleata]TWT86129.1 hypothetical protein Pla100_61740 [Neorhodopirellula pilleata]
MTVEFARRSRKMVEPSRDDDGCGSFWTLGNRVSSVFLVFAGVVCVGFPGCRPQTAPPSASSATRSEVITPAEPAAKLPESNAPAVETANEPAPEEPNPTKPVPAKPAPMTPAPIKPESSEPAAAMAPAPAIEPAPAIVPATSAEQGKPLTQAELDEEYVPDPEIMAELEAQAKALRRLADTYGPPAGGTQLGVQPDLWVDMKAKRIYIDGYVTMRRGPLEMLACPVGTKEHESVIAVFAKSSEVHAALLAIGAESGTTARWDPEFKPPTGQTVAVWVMHRNEKEAAPSDETEVSAQDNRTRYRPFVPGDQFNVVDARRWVRNVETKEELAEPWVFAGSEFWTDPDEKVEHYSANAGDMICVSNFSTAMMDVPFASSADAGNTLFEPFTERIPEQGTPVRLVLVPLPSEADKTERSIAPEQPPEVDMLPLGDHSPEDDAKGADSKEAEPPVKTDDSGS